MVEVSIRKGTAVDAFDEDAEPFDLKDDGDSEDDGDGDDDLDIDDATEDDVDFVVAVYREDGRPLAVPMDFDLANDFDELVRQLGRIPGDSGATGFVSVAGEFFVVCRVRGRTVEVLLSDAGAANDWPLARDIVDYLNVEIPNEEDDSSPVGDMDMFAANGLRAFELEQITTDYDEDSDELVRQIISKLKMVPEFDRAVESYDN